TTSATCGTVANSASASATNETSGTNNSVGPVNITVNCPDIQVTKTADQATINAGDTAAYTIKVESNGAGDAYGVTLSDPLPSGVTWQIDQIDGVAYGTIVSPPCAITAGTLACSFGTMVTPSSHTVKISGTT